MKVHIIEHVEEKAEGDCLGLPYNTEIISSQGCEVLFWLGERDPKAPETKALLERAIRIARYWRDVVRVIACPGQPTGYWARDNMGEDT